MRVSVVLVTFLLALAQGIQCRCWNIQEGVIQLKKVCGLLQDPSFQNHCVFSDEPVSYSIPHHLAIKAMEIKRTGTAEEYTAYVDFTASVLVSLIVITIDSQIAYTTVLVTHVDDFYFKSIAAIKTCNGTDLMSDTVHGQVDLDYAISVSDKALTFYLLNHQIDTTMESVYRNIGSDQLRQSLIALANHGYDMAIYGSKQRGKDNKLGYSKLYTRGAQSSCKSLAIPSYCGSSSSCSQKKCLAFYNCIPDSMKGCFFYQITSLVSGIEYASSSKSTGSCSANAIQTMCSD